LAESILMRWWKEHTKVLTQVSRAARAMIARPPTGRQNGVP
jgi:hypothetical protein